MGFTLGCRHSSFSHPWRALLAHLVALHLLHLGSAQMRVVAPNLHYTAIVGQDVVLRCQLSPCKDAWSSDIRWFQRRSAGLVHHYRNGEDLEQMEEYKGRIELLRDGLSVGNLDLRITAVISADSGSYICAVEDGDGYADAVVELEVSDPFSQITHPWKVALAVVVTLLVGSSVLIIVFLHRKQAAKNRVLKGKDAALAEQTEKLERKVAVLAEQAERMEKKDAMLEEQAEKMKKKDAMLVELSRMLKSSDAELDTLSRKLVEISTKFNSQNSQLMMHCGTMNLSALELKNQAEKLKKRDRVLEIKAEELVDQTEALMTQRFQLEHHCEEMGSVVADLKKHTAELERRDVTLEEQVAKLVEQTEAFQKPSKRGLGDEPCHTVTIGDELHGPQIAQDTKPTISPSQQGNPQQDQEEPVSVLRENPAVL